MLNLCRFGQLSSGGPEKTEPEDDLRAPARPGTNHRPRAHSEGTLSTVSPLDRRKASRFSGSRRKERVMSLNVVLYARVSSQRQAEK